MTTPEQGLWLVSFLLLAIGANTQAPAYPRITTIFQGSTADMWGLAYDPGQNVLYYSRTAYNDLREYNLDSGSENQVAGALSQPKSMAFSGGKVYFSDTGSSDLKQMDVSNYLVSSLGGSFTVDASGAPKGIVALPDGSILVSDRAVNNIQMFQNGAFTRFAGPLAYKPFSLAYNANNADLYFAERDGNRVFAINVNLCMSGDCSVNVVAGQSVAKLVTDGTGRDINTGGEGTATFEGIMSMAHDPISDTLYVGEDYGPNTDSLSVIRAISTSVPTYDVITVAGKSTAFLANDPNFPPKGIRGLCILDANNVAFVDSSNVRIRKLTLSSHQPLPPPSFPPSPLSPLPSLSPSPPSPSPLPPPPSPSLPPSPSPLPPPLNPPPPRPLPPPPLPSLPPSLPPF
eukprot:CAMPEP_0202370800 /NCGR_PEP_ID=MMETSP1127-20130417/2319_1 /ASSEMBLY_ACC=CAM_ASM_000462 /TAXON_ID=3047 /ORGANISM="Dunaliella tertiolecta, Strain CCMP1320" /LENGTH=400 /DNA_ID=CAMNT_0048966823 /DNA_START=64 /DNA_END=1263 /DNA_ORIENTATION=+